MPTRTEQYLKMLEHSYEVEQKFKQEKHSRLSYISDHIFGFVTYDDSKGEMFARKAIEVCAAISERTTYEYIENKANYTWFLLMLNMPFFSSKIDWGCSIRGAFWDSYDKIELESCGLWDGDEQLSDPIKFCSEDWISFVSAVISFSNQLG